MKSPIMIGAHPRKVAPGGLVARRRPRREPSMELVKRVAEQWLNRREQPVPAGNLFS